MADKTAFLGKLIAPTHKALGWDLAGGAETVGLGSEYEALQAKRDAALAAARKRVRLLTSTPAEQGADAVMEAAGLKQE